jgi:Esterase FrsA-like
MSMNLDSSLSRRGLLAGALAAGSAGALARVPGAFAASGASPSGAPSGSGGRQPYSFFADPSLNFQLLFTLGAVGYGAAESGEVLATFERIHGRGDSYRATFEEFLGLGRALRASGEEHLAAGRVASARSSYLRAAGYLDQALFFTLASGEPTRRHEGAVYREMESAWASAAALFRPRFERVRIPYRRGHLPGWFLSPGGKGRRPTLILNNGSDAQNIDMYVYGGAAALERGWNALIFEGPGQGGELFLRNIPFVPDWERVITPVVSWLRTRPTVDKRRISLIGQSFGGYLVMRAAAFEHRLAAVVADPGVVNAFVSWEDGLPASLLALLYAGQRDAFNAVWAHVDDGAPEAQRFQIAKRTEIYGRGGGFERLQLGRKFVLTHELASRIRTPAAALSPELEQFFPGQPQKLYDWLHVHKALIPFTVAEGAQYHCEPMAPQLRNERVFGWLEEVAAAS